MSLLSGLSAGGFSFASSGGTTSLSGNSRGTEETKIDRSIFDMSIDRTSSQNRFTPKYDLSGFDEPLFSNNIFENIKVCYSSIVSPIGALEEAN